MGQLGRRQAALARLSTRGEQRVLATGRQMHLETPEDVAKAIRDSPSALAKKIAIRARVTALLRLPCTPGT